MSEIQYEMDLTVITLLDGLKHNYFSRIEWNKDNYSPIGTAQLILPTEDAMFHYWTTYHDVVVVSAKLKNNKQNTNTKQYYQKIISERTRNLINQKQDKKYTKQQKKSIMKIFKQRIQNDEYNFSFIGRIPRTHRQGKKLIIDLEDIGWKFLQYVPDEFRKQYVAGQPVDDTFQAMCELMGVEFAYSLETLNEYTFANDGYSITKDNKTIEVVPNLFDEIKNETKENAKTPNTESEELNKLNKKLAELKKAGKKKEAKSLASEILNKKKELSSSGPSQNIDSQSDKQKKYEEDFESKIKDLFIGNTFYDSELTDTTYHYDAITVTPKTTSSSSSLEEPEDPNPDTSKSMKKTQKNIASIVAGKNINDTITSQQILSPISQTSGLTSVKPKTNILRSIK